jgi:putative membrane protein
MSVPDPRVFFASERTLLAWLRTGITVMALGFVVSRFGLFLRLVSAQAHHEAAAGGLVSSAILGVAFVALGALSIAFAAIQHRRYLATLPAADLPPAYSRGFAVALSLLVAALGLGLAAYMVATQA